MPKVSSPATKGSSKNRSLTLAHASDQAKPPRKCDPIRSKANSTGVVSKKIPHSAASSSPTHVPTIEAPSQPIPPVEHQEAARFREIASWSASDDETLIKARRRGSDWSQIVTEHFPMKTANACRKRYERLMERQIAEQWEGDKLGVFAQAYMEARRDMWSMLEARVGVKWTVLEQKCMEKGLKTLTQAYRISQKNQDQIETQTNPVASGSGSNTMPAPRTVDAPTATLPQQDVERPPAKPFKDRHLRHFDRSNSIAARVPDTLKERLKYTISTDGTVHDTARQRSRFMALERTTNAERCRRIP